MLFEIDLNGLKNVYRNELTTKGVGASIITAWLFIVSIVMYLRLTMDIYENFGFWYVIAGNLFLIFLSYLMMGIIKIKKSRSTSLESEI